MRLMHLGSGAAIPMHVDRTLSLDHGSIRLHMPLATNDQVEFYVGGIRYPMQVGECWYMNATYPHEVFNKGATDRIHLVFDCKSSEALRKYFPSAYFEPSKKRILACKYRW